MSNTQSQSGTSSRSFALQLQPETQYAKTEDEIELRKFPDGPWQRHPNEIAESICTTSNSEYPRDISLGAYRTSFKRQLRTMLSQNTYGRIFSERKIAASTKVEAGWTIPELADMSDILKFGDDEIAECIEHQFVNCDLYVQPSKARASSKTKLTLRRYLAPGRICPISVIAKHSRDWTWNARGIYYRHYYSPLWVTNRPKLWIPIIDDRTFDTRYEDRRRSRARQLLHHAMDNERWNKSEYAWEADAWNDVFGQMRSDPALAAYVNPTCPHALHSVRLS